VVAIAAVTVAATAAIEMTRRTVAVEATSARASVREEARGRGAAEHPSLLARSLVL